MPEHSKEILRLAQVYAMRLHVSLSAYACPNEAEATAQANAARNALIDYVTALEAK